MLRETGRVFPDPKSLGPYAKVMAQALNLGLGDTHRAVKTVMRWTGAGERTVKNWFAGVSGPNGEHLIGLIRHSDEVLEALLLLGGREQIIAGKKIVEARDKLGEMLAVIQTLVNEASRKAD